VAKQSWFTGRRIAKLGTAALMIVLLGVVLVAVFLRSGHDSGLISGHLNIRPGFSADLDTGREVSGSGDLRFDGADTPEGAHISAGQSVKMQHLETIKPRTYQLCADARSVGGLTAQPIRVKNLNAGSIVCVETKQGNLSLVILHRAPKSGMALAFSYTTWK
jgi:hypothetical protein